MRNFNLTEEIRPKKTIEQTTAEKATLVFDLISRVLYTAIFLKAKKAG
ncbi:MAG: hypothetical protein HYT94_03755 [Parcubacteria group bacterium]|nr:hypothetical protein [Parcubacteria group bacterium]